MDTVRGYLTLVRVVGNIRRHKEESYSMAHGEEGWENQNRMQVRLQGSGVSGEGIISDVRKRKRIKRRLVGVNHKGLAFGVE